MDMIFFAENGTHALGPDEKNKTKQKTPKMLSRWWLDQFEVSMILIHKLPSKIPLYLKNEFLTPKFSVNYFPHHAI